MRVLLIGDGMCLSTGFGTVIRHLAREFVDRGWDVWQIACLDTPPKCDAERYRRLGVTPRFPSADLLGYSVAQDVIDECRPDVIVVNMDAGSAWNYQERVLSKVSIPTVLYAPIEGQPIHPYLAQAFRRATRAATYTRWSAEQLAQQHRLEVPWVYHGVDTDVFQPLPRTRRAEIRRELGWEGRFVTAYVARNNGRKGHDRLLKAAAGLPAHHLVYLHCLPYDQFELGGWDLGWLAEYWGVLDKVQFSPQASAGDGLSSIDLADRLAAADVYVSASQVEGFGLPILEAMSCGLPVVVPEDHGNQEEVVGDGGYALAPVRDWNTWHTGAQLGAVYPGHFAQSILHAEQHPDLRQEAGERARARALLPEFRWEHMAGTIADLVLEAANVGKVAVPA